MLQHLKPKCRDTSIDRKNCLSYSQEEWASKNEPDLLEKSNKSKTEVEQCVWDRVIQDKAKKSGIDTSGEARKHNNRIIHNPVDKHATRKRTVD